MKKTAIIFISILAVLILLIGIWFLFFKQNQVEENSVPEIIEKKEVELDKIIEVEELPIIPDRFEHDKDRDGLSDEKEAELGLSDYEFDTDKDSLSDKMEVEVYGTDPTKKDTDGDGFGDAIEVLNGFNPLGEGKLEN